MKFGWDAVLKANQERISKGSVRLFEQSSESTFVMASQEPYVGTGTMIFLFSGISSFFQHGALVTTSLSTRGKVYLF